MTMMPAMKSCRMIGIAFPGAELAHVAVDAGHDVRHSLTDGDQNAEELLRAVTASKRSRGHERVSALVRPLEKIRRAEKRPAARIRDRGKSVHPRIGSRGCRGAIGETRRVDRDDRIVAVKGARRETGGFAHSQ